MTLLGVGAIMQALTRADVRFIVAGGLAVSIHGYVRERKRKWKRSRETSASEPPQANVAPR